MHNHIIFCVSHLDHYTPPVIGQQSSEPHPVIVVNLEEWAIERIVDSKQRNRNLHLLVQWAGYSHIRTSGEHFENVQNAQELIDKFHRDYPNKHWRQWKSNLRGGGIDGNGDIEVQVNWAFPSIFFCWDLVQYNWHRHGFYHLRQRGQRKVEFPRATGGHPGWY